MEEQITEKNYYFNLFNIPLKFCNSTFYKTITYPRRQFIKKETCKVYLYNSQIYSMDRHWRPGEILSELEWLSEVKPLDEDDQRVFEQFASYCMDPVAFLEDNKFYHNGMKDYWCFDHKQIKDCFIDFLSVELVHKTDLNVFELYLSKLEKDWRAVFFSEPSYEDLIKSRFLCLPRL